MLAVLLASGCGGGSGNDAPPPGAGTPPPGGGTPPPTAETGLDTRPANLACVAPARPDVGSGVLVQRVFPNQFFSQPVQMVQAPGDEAHWYVVEKSGQVFRFENRADASARQQVIDLRAEVDARSEGGLLGMAFAPDFASSARVYLSYTRAGSGPVPMQSVIARFTSPDGGRTLDPDSEQVLLTIDQPFTNHNGGGIAFGPDGHLYLGMGDGGSGGDPLDQGQDTTTLLGTFLRLDVSGADGYAIPPDNPFSGNAPCTGGSGAADCPEIYAWGLRNPWRWSFDRDTGALWAGDVGQSTREEINLIELGGNYGWRFREGFLCFNPSSNCPRAGLVDPIIDYRTGIDGSSVTGGYVYRGAEIPGLRGRYVFGDFVNGRIWALTSDPDGTYAMQDLAASGLNISSFAEDHQGELYVVNFGGGLYRLAPSGTAPADTIPALLSDTGCVDPADPSQPAEGLIPYRPGAPFWSDGADKERWLALPDGARIDLASDGNFEFPPGAVLMKHFRRGGQLIETRLFMHHPEGQWGGYTWRWNAAQTDAERVIGGATLPAGGGDWVYPSEAQCLQCHTAAAGRTLGLEIAQLNNALTYAQTGRTANQLRTLAAIELFTSPLPGEPEELPALPDPFGSAPVGERARAWLHTNCAGCHRPDGPTPSDLDLRFDVPLDETRACNVEPSSSSGLGLTDPRLIVPGDPQRSLVWQRMGRRDVHAMPPVGSLDIDTAGLSLVQDWITSLAGCD